ncbi:CGNR zinc finger domain-containing protein [Pseudonocardia yuanmonensis]|uniref:CGNR zinc finger domain-containing protein n=1 Tax=Pseudonocardia yuanmonensis TaxID=1095914 RepID=A0ABP8XMA6_9PSEU
MDIAERGEPLPVELMNTIRADRTGLHDSLATQEEALGWLSAALPPAPDRVDLDRLRLLRDALRRLAAERTGDPREAAESAVPTRGAALRVLNEACADAPTWSSLRWAPGEAPVREIRSDAPPDRVLLATLAEQAVRFLTGPEAAQLRACLAPGCVLYFVRHHPRREWCSASCGNRARVARHYRRNRGTGRLLGT